MLGTGPKMYKEEEGPAMYADEPSGGPKAMKPDFIDIDKDGNTTESMKSASKSQGAKSISAPQNARPSKKGVPPHVKKQNSKGAKSMGPKGHTKGHETTQVYEKMNKDTYRKREAARLRRIHRRKEQPHPRVLLRESQKVLQVGRCTASTSHPASGTRRQTPSP